MDSSVRDSARSRSLVQSGLVGESVRELEEPDEL